MKLTILILAFVFSLNTFAQTLPNFDIIKLEKAPDYKLAEPYALQTANFILSTPFKKEDKDKINSLNIFLYVMKRVPRKGPGDSALKGNRFLTLPVLEKAFFHSCSLGKR